VKPLSDSESEDEPMPIRVAKERSATEEEDDFVVDDEDELELESMEDAITGHARGSGYERNDNHAFEESHGHVKRLKRVVRSESESECSSDADLELVEDGKGELTGKATRVISESESEDEAVLLESLPKLDRPFAKFESTRSALPINSLPTSLPRFVPPKSAKSKSTLASLDSAKVAGLVTSFNSMQKQESRSGFDDVFIAKSESQTGWGKAVSGGAIGFKGMLNKR
jgi:hypothetical protein